MCRLIIKSTDVEVASSSTFTYEKYKVSLWQIRLFRDYTSKEIFYDSLSIILNNVLFNIAVDLTGTFNEPATKEIPLYNYMLVNRGFNKWYLQTSTKNLMQNFYLT